MITATILALLAPAPVACVPDAYVDDLGTTVRLRLDDCAGPVVSIDLDDFEARAAYPMLLAASWAPFFGMFLTPDGERFEVDSFGGPLVCVAIANGLGDDAEICVGPGKARKIARAIAVASS